MNMTENLLQKLEERTISLITELEEQRKRSQELLTELTALKNEKEKAAIERNHQEQKIKELIGLVDAITNLEMPAAVNSNITSVKPVLVQG